MVPSASQRQCLFLYPEPIQAPDVPSRPERKANPRISGWFLIVAAYLMEWVGFIRVNAWRNAGFGALRDIYAYLALTEPRYDATVFPLTSKNDEDDRVKEVQPQGVADATPRSAAPNAIADLHHRFLSAELTPLDVVRAILPLIRRDTNPPGVHCLAWFEVNADLAIKAAEDSTQRYKEGKPLGLLDGVPTAVKDEYDMGRYKTTLGSPTDYMSLYQSFPVQHVAENEKLDSWCVRKLEEGGAIILGKLSMHEYGMDTPGYNITYGTPRNPYNSNYYCGGSSSGSAYAIAAGLVPFTLGSDGGGSIRIPASFCAVFGLKPTHGRVSFFPMQNHSNTSAVNGPLAADMRSLATLYAAIKAPDPYSLFPKGSSKSINLSYDDPTRQKLLGIPEAWIQRSTPAIQHLCREMIDWLVEYKGYKSVPIDIPLVAEGQIAHALTLLTDAATLLPNTKSISPANKILLALGRTTPASDYQLAQKLRRVLMQHLAWLWSQHPGMIIMTPTTACAGWPIRDEAELRFGISDGDQTMKSMEYVWMANFCGVPGISVPAGFVAPDGVPGEGEVVGSEAAGKIPVGLMGMGEWCDEEALLRFGADAEEAGWDLGTRRSPEAWVDVPRIAKEIRLSENERNGQFGEQVVAK
ncbi:putative amidase [Seiridium cardinale]